MKNARRFQGAAESRMLPLFALGLSALLLAAVAAPPASAADPVYSNWRGLAIRGADPVAYFTEGAYRAGSSMHTTEWMGATWRFASAEHKALFEANPEAYSPEYGGYCAYAISQGSLVSSDPESFSLVEGKLYLNYSPSIHQKWLEDRSDYVEAADANWPGLRDD